MICTNCKENLNFINIFEETRRGLYSLWSIKCEKCSIFNHVSSGKIHGQSDDQNNNGYCDINSEAA